jgi:hypothetical protein
MIESLVPPRFTEQPTHPIGVRHGRNHAIMSFVHHRAPRCRPVQMMGLQNAVTPKGG